MNFSKAEIISALTRGVDWLMSQRQPDGSWRADFGFRQGPASCWTTAYVMNRLPTQVKTLNLLAGAEHFLMETRLSYRAYGGDGWGYNNHTPPDLDSTLEVMRFLGNSGWPTAATAQLLPLIRRDGGLSTYTEENARAMLPASCAATGWTSSHLEITTHALQWATNEGAHTSGSHELQEQMGRYIKNYLNSRGYECYWYPHPIIAAAQVLRSVGSNVSWLPKLPLHPNTKHLDWETRHNPFVTAHALEAALRSSTKRYRKVIIELSQNLIVSQRPDGAWRPCHVLRVPYPDETEPRMVQHTNADYKQPIVTVAAVVAALDLLLQAL